MSAKRHENIYIYFHANFHSGILNEDSILLDNVVRLVRRTVNELLLFAIRRNVLFYFQP